MVKRVIAFEDDPALRSQLENVFFSIRKEYKLVASFPHPLHILKELKAFHPDIVLMDLQMLEEDDGLVALYKIKQTAPDIKVLVLTMFDADQKVFNAICLGADGYMLKSDFSSNQLPQEAMRKSLEVILEGGAYLSPSVARQILKLFNDPSIADRIQRVKDRFQSIFQKQYSRYKYHEAGLTRMQTTVLQKIVEGKSTSEIAKDLEISDNTVNSHIKLIYLALGVHSRAMAIKKAVENKWHT